MDNQRPITIQPPKKRKTVTQVINIVDESPEVPLKPQTAKKSKTPKKAASPKTQPGYKKPQFRIDALNFFLTVPQYKGTLTPKDIMEKIKEFTGLHCKELTSCIVSLENHGVNNVEEAKGIEKQQDPGVHFHVAMKFETRWNIKNPNWFDGIFGQHVHIESAKNYQAVVVYCAKDGNYVTHNINIDAFRRGIGKKTGVKHLEVAEYIIKTPEVPMKTLLEKFPDYMIQHQKKVIDFASLCQTINVETTPYLGLEDYSHVNEQSKIICEWLTVNLFPNKRRHKQKQLYIHGPTNIRKTTLLMRLMESFSTYIVAEEGNQLYWTSFHDGYELAIFDEFNGGKAIYQMNSFLEGAPVKLAQKGGDAIIKKKNIPVIICSNKSPAQVYRNVATEQPQVLEALLSRLLVVDCSSFIEGDYIDIPWKQPVVDLEKSDTNLTIPKESTSVSSTEQSDSEGLSDCECDDSEDIDN